MRARYENSFKETTETADEIIKIKTYLVVLPKDVSYEEKMDRLSEYADVAIEIEGSDVFLQAIWIED